MPVNSKTIGLILGPISFLSILLFFHPIGLSAQANAVLAVTSWVAIWWISEAVQVEVTALLPIVLFPLTGGLKLDETCAAYGHKYIFLFIGGFIIALAIEKWNLHRRIALSIINVVGTNLKNIILGFMISTAFLSMWISNTATAVMMLPIGLAIVNQMEGSKKKAKKSKFGKALMLSIAYSASIGGMATLIGTPPNLIFAGVIDKIYGIEITFMQWFMVGFPIAVVLLIACWKYLTSIAYNFKTVSIPGGKSAVSQQLKSLGKISFEEKSVLFVFVFTAVAWITRSFLIKPFLPNIDDTIIAIFAAFILFLLPASKPGKRLMYWKDAVKLPWGILMLFGGGIAIAAGFENSRLAEWIADQLTALEGIHLLLLLFLLIAAVNFFTEITSNLATASVLLPILSPLAFAMDVHPFVLMVGCTVAASCAFMLPVATPPNAIVFGSGYLKIKQMMRAGIWMNIVSILILTAVVYFLLPLIWDFNISEFPKEWRK